MCVIISLLIFFFFFAIVDDELSKNSVGVSLEYNLVMKFFDFMRVGSYIQITAESNQKTGYNTIIE